MFLINFGFFFVYLIMEYKNSWGKILLTILPLTNYIVVVDVTKISG